MSGDGPGPDRDPVADHVAELGRALRGTPRARRSLLREVREGMQDTADGYRRVGIDADRAARLAVRDFGPVSDLAPLYQEELAAAQGRRTALLLAMGVPALVIGWDLLWASGAATSPPAPHAIYALARFQEVAGGLIALTALVLLLLTARPTRSPRRTAAASAATALATLVACGGAAVAMLCVHGPAAGARIAAQPTGALAYLVSATMLVLVHRSAMRTLHALRGPAPC